MWLLLAPLALCELLPAGAPCSLVLTEIDGSIGKDVSALLHELSRTERISALQLDNDGRFWQFQLAGHPVRIELELVGRGSLVEPALVHDADLVINHDWSGDPLGILMVVHELLLALRSLDGAPPMLMIEDLERHSVRRKAKGLKGEMRHVLVVNVQMEDRKEDRLFFDSTRVRRRAEFRLNRGDLRRDAREEVIRELARRVVSQAFERWPKPKEGARVAMEAEGRAR